MAYEQPQTRAQRYPGYEDLPPHWVNGVDKLAYLRNCHGFWYHRLDANIAHIEHFRVPPQSGNGYDHVAVLVLTDGATFVAIARQAATKQYVRRYRFQQAVGKALKRAVVAQWNKAAPDFHVDWEELSAADGIYRSTHLQTRARLYLQGKGVTL